VILEGARSVPTKARPTPLSMPAFDWKLTDAQIAAVATYIRSAWGNAASPVAAGQVAPVRKATRTSSD
jgi:mono/diheme cytochrome c family protein